MSKPLVYVDTDVGLGTPRAEIDDASALIMLMTSQDVTLLGAGSVFGNVPCADATANLCRLQSFFNRSDVQIGQGAMRPLVEDLTWFTDWTAGYGATLPFDVPAGLPSSARLLIDLVKAHPRQVTLLAIGPMTDLALAARLEPDFVPLVKEVVAMGGSFGSDREEPEFNFRCDPEAAHIVLGAGWPVTLIGLNITRQVSYSRKEFAGLKGAHPATRLLREMAPVWIDRVEKMGWEQGGCALHDAVAVACLLQPGLFRFTSTGVRVELRDASMRGVVRFADDPSLPQARIATGIDLQKCHDLVWSLIQNCER